ncbi:PEP-CTERM sorting domain-containing protein [Methylophilus sp. 3sh_L]|uniref:PEP-CTERM sorting domain-containing protein n=1 Tax=Methylophilus sp. 3sh_L TaxID=3377114 RepID=UPI00398F0044
MKASHVLGPIALAMTLAFSGQASATVVNVTPLGNLNDGPVSNQSLLQVGAFFLPDVYTFSLTSDSNVTVDFKALLGIGAGSSFSLYDSADNLISSYSIPALIVDATASLSFIDIGAGTGYQFKFNPGAFNVTLSNKLTFTATPVIPVPEPENNALMLAGLGIIGLIARRKFA